MGDWSQLFLCHPVFTRVFRWPSNGNTTRKTFPSLANPSEASRNSSPYVATLREPSLPPPPRLSWIAMPPYFATGLQDSFPMVTFSPYRFPHPPESLLMPGALSFTSPTSIRHLNHFPSPFGSIFSHTCYARYSNRFSNHLSSGPGPLFFPSLSMMSL